VIACALQPHQKQRCPECLALYYCLAKVQGILVLQTRHCDALEAQKGPSSVTAKTGAACGPQRCPHHCATFCAALSSLVPLEALSEWGLKPEKATSWAAKPPKMATPKHYFLLPQRAVYSFESKDPCLIAEKLRCALGRLLCLREWC